MEPKSLVQKLGLLPHPEGGYYKETYRSSEQILVGGLPNRFEKERAFSTGIYYLLEKDDFSAFHRIKSDEMWHFYAGTTLLIHEINDLGEHKIHRLGSDLKNGDIFQLVIPHGSWFASEVEDKNSYAFVGCTVAPGFDFADFEIAKRSDLQMKFKNCSRIIESLTR